MRTQITRTSWCQACYDAQRPKTESIFAVKGSHGWHIKQVDYTRPQYNPYGYVPHIFELSKVEDGNIIGWKACCMHECGIEVSENPRFETGESKAQYVISYLNKVDFKMSIADWNALVMTKDFGYKIE